MKDILVHLARDKRNDVRLKAALGLAAASEARVTGLYTLTQPILPMYAMDYIPVEIIEQQRAETAAAAEAYKESFDRLCDKAGVEAEWRVGEGDPVDLLSMHARYADLAVVGQPDPDDERLPPGTETLPHELVLGCGRPLLVIPYAGKFDRFGKRILLAWNGSREATRAVHDALPLLKAARKAIVFSVNPSKKDHIPGADIATHLAHHGVRVEVAHTVAKDIEVGDALLSALSDLGADMLVMGAWGHSRLRELTLGGATRDLLAQMTAPVLLSH